MPMANVEVGVGGGAGSRVRLDRLERDGRGAARAWTQRARRGRRSRAGPRVLLSLPRRPRGQSRSGGPRPRRRSARPSIRLRFAVCGCSHFETGYFTAFKRLAAEQFDFVFHTGDYIYEGRDDGGRNPALVRQHQGDEIYTLVDYRNRYAQYKMDAGPQGRARVGAVHRDLGRSRGRQRLRRQPRRERHAARGLPAAPRGRLSGVLRDDAAARGDHSERPEHAAVSEAAVRHPARSERARHASVPFEAGLRRRRQRRDARRRSIRPGRFSGRRRSSGCSSSSRA